MLTLRFASIVQQVAAQLPGLSPAETRALLAVLVREGAANVRLTRSGSTNVECFSAAPDCLRLLQEAEVAA